jgi:antitoxin MazE
LTSTSRRNYNVLMRTAKNSATAKFRAIKGKLVPIGNSRGIRLPKTVIEQAGLTTDVEIAVGDNQIIIRSAGNDDPRAGWEKQIKRVLAEHGEDGDAEWLNAPLASKFDEKEWTW